MWSKNGEVVPDHVTVRNQTDSTVLFIRKTEVEDSGDYLMRLRVGDDEEQTATLKINVIGMCDFSVINFLLV